MGKKAKPPTPPPEPPEPESGKEWSAPITALLGEIASRFPGVERRDGRLVGEPALLVSPSDALKVASFLKDNTICPFDYCRSVTGTDKVDRFEVTYNLARLPGPGEAPDAGFETLGLIVVISDRENPRVPTLRPVWLGADFQEREVFDLLGIEFDGHPDLRRILLDEAFIGHPLRKDYPLIGRWEDMEAMDAHLDEHQIRTMKEEAGLDFNPDDVPPSFKR